MNVSERAPRWPWVLVLAAVVFGVAAGSWVYAVVTGA
jgi:hypothetical protein